MKKETISEAIERRKKTYGCDGLCYGGMIDGKECQICGGIDTCEETRTAEGLAELFAVLIILGIPIAIIVALIMIIF